jgi:hypothetical protein
MLTDPTAFTGGQARILQVPPGAAEAYKQFCTPGHPAAVVRLVLDAVYSLRYRLGSIATA